MELQSSLPGHLSPGPLSPTMDYAGPLSPSSGGPGRGPSPGLSPVRGPSPGPGFSGQAAFNYNQLEGRFKQLQGKKGAEGSWFSLTQTSSVVQLESEFPERTSGGLEISPEKLLVPEIQTGCKSSERKTAASFRAERLKPPACCLSSAPGW